MTVGIIDETDESTADRELAHSRLIDAPPERVVFEHLSEVDGWKAEITCPTETEADA